MKTDVLTISPGAPEADRIACAAEVLQRGQLVAFPTETVYGLGANALDSDAVARIFEAKGRPAFNPVIVHVADVDAVKQLAAEWPDTATQLAERFWPGPLTLVVKKAARIPDIVTAGGLTVGIRVPAHPVALALLKEAGVPVAAPSANRSTEVSPTRAEHVLKGLDGRIAMVLDGGPTTGGIESTVLDLSREIPRLLRPGLISAEQIEEVIGPIVRLKERESGDSPLPSPGLMRRHYSPQAKVEMVVDSGRQRVEELVANRVSVGWMPMGHNHVPGAETRPMPSEAHAYAAQLYSTLHALDEAGVNRIIIQRPPNEPEWLAVIDRLTRAASDE